MNNRIGLKLALGFGAVLAITTLLGGLTAWKMNAVARDAIVASEQTFPGVEVESDINDRLYDMVLNIRSFAQGDDEQSLKNYESARAGCETRLQDGERLVARYPGQTDLRVGLAATKESYDRFVKLCVDSIAAKSAEQGAIQILGPVGVDVAKTVASLDDAQQEALKNGIAAGWDGAATAKQAEICHFAAGLRNDVLALRISNWKAQALGDFMFMDSGLASVPAIEQALDHLAAVLPAQADQERIGTARTALKAYRDAMIVYRDAATRSAAVAGQRDDIGTGLVNSTAKMNADGLELSRDAADSSAKTLTAACTIVYYAVGAALALGILIAYLITDSVTKPVARIIRTLVAGSDQTSLAAGNIAESSQNLARSASEQAASLQETGSSLEEISSMTRRNAETARQASTLSAEAKATSDQGNAAMARMGAAIREIEKSALETAKIVKTIDEIAFQTNLLALNAAVEAARAGEAGKGFAVVAEEVRNLAMRSAEAARTTANLIEGSVQNAKGGVTIAQEVAEFLADITIASGKVNHLVAEIAAASREQSQGVGQVSQAVQQMDRLTQSNAAAAEEAAASAQELNGQSEQMRGIVRELQKLVQGDAPFDCGRAKPEHESPSAQPSRLAFFAPNAPRPRPPAKKSEDFSDFNIAA